VWVERVQGVHTHERHWFQGSEKSSRVSGVHLVETKEVCAHKESQLHKCGHGIVEKREGALVGHPL
jgi:hypothetical protein